MEQLWASRQALPMCGADWHREADWSKEQRMLQRMIEAHNVRIRQCQ